jgi:hypothetical protein
MKFQIFVVALLSALSVSGVHAQVARDNSNRPCIEANVQADQSNTARVNQNCRENLSRTIQAGQVNTAETQQKGQRNDNAVEQMGYEGPKRRAVPPHGQQQR